jgi:hypothetical protein
MKVLTGVKYVHDLNGTGNLVAGSVPDPFGTVCDYDLLRRALPAPIPRFQIESQVLRPAQIF